MRTLPKRIIRLDDGMEFLLNEETQKYRIHLGILHLDDPKHLHFEYDFEALSNPKYFKIADGTEDVKAMRQKWLDEMNALMRKNRGCGY